MAFALAGGDWTTRAPLPVARTEVAAATVGAGGEQLGPGRADLLAQPGAVGAVRPLPAYGGEDLLRGAGRAFSAGGSFEMLDAPVRRLAGENVPLPFADALEERVIPTVQKLVEEVRRLTSY